MEDAEIDTQETSQTLLEAPTLAVEGATAHSLDHENRKALEDMFEDDGEDGPAPAVEDAVASGSDKENRKALEDMFDDDSEDDQFGSSAPQASAATASSQEHMYVNYICR
jgi:hypothetical protein